MNKKPSRGFVDARIYSRAFRLFNLGSEREQITLMNRLGSMRAFATPEQILELKPPRVSDGLPLRVHLIPSGEGEDKKWLVERFEPLSSCNADWLKLIPLNLCPNKVAISEFRKVNFVWKNPALKLLMQRVFQELDFTYAFLREPRWDDDTDVPGGILLEAALAAQEVESNPVLNDAQRELARAAVLLNRPGRVWKAGEGNYFQGPDDVALASKHVVWMQSQFPAQFRKLEIIWSTLAGIRLIDDEARLNREVALACWSAMRVADLSLGATRVHSN